MLCGVGRRGPGAPSTVDPADVRRLPPRSGSAARNGCVGRWLILGSGMPELRACPARITPSSVLAHRPSAPRAHLDLRHGFDLRRDGPQNANELPRDRHDGNLRPLRVAAPSRMRDHRRRGSRSDRRLAGCIYLRKINSRKYHRIVRSASIASPVRGAALLRGLTG